MDPAYGMQHIVPEVTHVIDTVSGMTARVYKILPTFGVQVWVKERGYERENWSWSMIGLRQPRTRIRYPRPVRLPRDNPTPICHCKIGKMEVANVEEREVRCQRCKNPIGSESFPNRIEKATKLLRAASTPKKSKHKISKGIRKRGKRKAFRRSNVSRKVGKLGTGSVVIRRRRREEKKHGTRKSKAKTGKRAAASKARKVSKS